MANGSAEGCEAICSFRVAGKQPELWHPESGSITPLMAYEEKDGCTHVPLRLGPTESVFIVFRRPAEAASRIVSATRDGQELLRIARSAAATVPTLDLVRGEIWQPGSYVFKTADGRSREVDCPRLAAPQEIGGPWEVAFDPKWGGPAKVTFEKLEDWSKRAEEGIKYYSGTASYRTTFKVSAEALKQPDARWYLDLGKVAVMAEVRAQRQGTRHRLEDALPRGRDRGPEAGRQRPRREGRQPLDQSPDRRRATAGRLRPQRRRHAEELAEWLQEGKPSPTGRYTFSSWKLWKKGDPLQESGLLGPVTLRQAVRIEW